MNHRGLHDGASNAGGTGPRTAGRAAALFAAAAITVVLAGCATGGYPMNNPSTGGTPQSAAPSQSGAADVPPKRWAAIVGDLATRGVPTDAVALVSARTVTWNDGSLGCPQPGQAYTQSLVPGMQVVVKVGTVEYDYRFGRTDNPKLCQK
jgi:hypothetical protein